MSENELYGEQDWVGCRFLAVSDVGAEKDALEQAGGLDNRFEAVHVTRVGGELVGSPGAYVERLWWL